MKTKIDHIRVSKADSGGFIAEHHHKDPPPRKGTSAWEGRKPPTTHVLKNAKALGDHVEKHMGGADSEE
jgi:hypothetical protein